MAPIPTLSRYELYKSGTSTLVSWLLTTASACGYGDPKASTTTIPVSKLRKCALAIAKRTPTVHVPGHIVELAEEVIQGRELYAELYIGGDGGGHMYFIQVLRGVHGILKETRRQFKRERPAVKSPWVATFGEAGALLPREHSLQSLFQHLEVEEPVCQPFSTPEKVKNLDAAVEADAGVTLKLDPAEERKFVLWCWLEDMLEIRKYVRELWEQFAKGEVSLDCATTTTEVAFGCMRRTEEDLYTAFGKLGFDDVVELFLTLVKELRAAGGEPESLCLEASHIACAVVAECMLFSLGKKNRPYRMRPEHEKIAAAEPFAKALLDLVPDFARAANPIDELRTQVHANGGQFKLQLSFVMIIQSYREIYNIIGDPSELVVNEVTDAIRRGLEAMKHYQAARWASKGPPSFGEPEELKSVLEQRLKDFAPMQPGYKGKASKFMLSEAAIFKAIPSSAGEQLKYLKWMISEKGAPIANDGWVITGLGYLYRAAQHYGLLDTVWEDLEWLINLQSRQRPYIIEVADHATDDFAFTRHYQLALGMPIGQFKNISRQKLIKSMRKIESQLEYPLVAQAQWESELLLGCERGEMSHVVLIKIFEKQHPTHNSNRFTSLQLIEAFKQSFMHDEAELNFSYPDFVASCMTLMSEIHRVVYPRLPEGLLDHFGKADVEVVGPVLKEAAMVKSAGREMIRAQIALVARIMEKHIKGQGGRFVGEARGRCSGSLSEERKPKLKK